MIRSSLSRCLVHARMRGQLLRSVSGSDSSILPASFFSSSPPSPSPSPRRIPGVRFVIAVASGKGGVGKSTVAVNLALGLSECGWRVSILDSDIYGPSIPHMLRLQNAGKPVVDENRLLVPLRNYGIGAMSMGFLMPNDAPAIWRGPMVMSAVSQLLYQVAWEPLDALVIDLPPGTGDAQLTLTQSAPLSGSVIVSTPQDIALIDARRAVNMFRKVNVPILGVVENMSFHQCSSCGHIEHIFGAHGARDAAKEMDIPFLGEIPLHMRIRESMDDGVPIVVSDPTSLYAKSFIDIAKGVIHSLESSSSDSESNGSSPRIIFE